MIRMKNLVFIIILILLPAFLSCDNLFAPGSMRSLLLITDKSKYRLSDSNQDFLVLILTLKNGLDSPITVPACGSFMTGSRKKTGNYWSVYDDGIHPCPDIYLGYLRVDANEEIQNSIYIPAEAGIYRLFLPFTKAQSHSSYPDTLFSNEFVVIE